MLARNLANDFPSTLLVSLAALVGGDFDLATAHVHAAPTAVIREGDVGA
jgi:hypothetical protein